MAEGESGSSLPPRAGDDSIVILSTETWEALLLYIETITPRGDEKTAKVNPTATGSIISAM